MAGGGVGSRAGIRGGDWLCKCIVKVNKTQTTIIKEETDLLTLFCGPYKITWRAKFGPWALCLTDVLQGMGWTLLCTHELSRSLF